MAKAGDFQAGDLVAFSGNSLVSHVIKAGTVSPLHWLQRDWENVSHIGICCALAGEVYLIESTGEADEPCAIAKRRFAGVQAHRPADRANHYDGHVYRARLSPLWTLDPNESNALSVALAAFVGRDYDYLGAVRAGLGRARAANLDQLFCSEVVAAVLCRRGLLIDSDPGEWTPAALLTHVVRTGKYLTPLHLPKEA